MFSWQRVSVMLSPRNIFATCTFILFWGNDPSKSPEFSMRQVVWLFFSRADLGFLSPCGKSFQSTSSTRRDFITMEVVSS